MIDDVTPKPPRRWSKRTQLLAVSSLIVGVVALAVGVMGVAHSFGFLMHAVDAAPDVGQIAPDRRTVAVNSVPPVSDALSLPTLASTPAPATPNSNALPRAVAPAAAPATQAGGADGTDETATEPESVGGSANTNGTGGGGTVDGSGGSAGTATAFWEGVTQNALHLLRQTTSVMCGPNTCNVGQVCCNTSCGICVAEGATCDQTPCAGAARAPTNFLCGSAQCNDGQVCCNPSCGICVAPGDTCSDQPCH